MSSNQSSENNDLIEQQGSQLETVPATAYVPQIQYQQWVEEADQRNQSISSLISSMVETGLKEFQMQEESPSEIVDLRQELQEVVSERDALRQELQAEEKSSYHVGLGRIKELIIKNPGIERHEIISYIASNSAEFGLEYVDHLESSKFVNKDGQWYPPEGVGDNQ